MADSLCNGLSSDVSGKMQKEAKGVHFMCSSIKIKDMVKQDCEELFLQATADGVINGCS